MNSHWITTICNVLSVCAALLSVFVAAWSVVQSRRTALTGVYLSEMTAAYSDFLGCVADFVFRRGLEERDALAAALYRLVLFASDEIADEAQMLYHSLLQWGKTNQSQALEVDRMVNHLGNLMRADVGKFRKTGRHGKCL